MWGVNFKVYESACEKSAPPSHPRNNRISAYALSKKPTKALHFLPTKSLHQLLHFVEFTKELI